MPERRSGRGRLARRIGKAIAADAVPERFIQERLIQRITQRSEDLRSRLHWILHSQPSGLVGAARQTASNSFGRKPLEQLGPEWIERKRGAGADERYGRAIRERLLQPLIDALISGYGEDVRKLSPNKDSIPLSLIALG